MNKENFNEKEIELYNKQIQNSYNNLINKDELNIINFDYKNSSINNIINFMNINTLSVNKLHTICIVFKIIRNFNIINYAYLYCEYNSDEKQIEYKYITLSPGLKSKYGEFRRRFICLLGR